MYKRIENTVKKAEYKPRGTVKGYGNRLSNDKQEEIQKAIEHKTPDQLGSSGVMDTKSGTRIHSV